MNYQKFLFVFILFLAGCCKSERVHHISLIGSVKIPNVRYLQSVSYITEKGNTDLWYFNDSNRFYKFSFEKKSIVDSFYILGRKLNVYDEFTVQNGKMYVLRSDENRIESYKRNSSLTNSYSISDVGLSLMYLYLPLKILPNNTSNIYAIPKALHIKYKPERAEYFSTKMIAKIKLLDTSISIVSRTGGFPKTYIENYYQEMFPVATYANNKIAYIFSKEPKLYLSDDKELEIHTIKNLKTNDLEKFDDDSFGNFGYKGRFQRQCEQYMSIRHDDLSSLYLIFQQHPVKLNQDNGDATTTEDQPFTMYLIGKDFSVIGRADFPKMGFRMPVYALFYNKRIYIPLMNPKVNYIEYEIYNVN